MARKLFTVEQAFPIQQRGTILVPGLTADSLDRLTIGDSLRLIRPDGSESVTTITGIDLSYPNPSCHFPVLVGLPEAEVPIGTEVWSN